MILLKIIVLFAVCCIVNGLTETTSCPIVQGIRLQCKPITNCPPLQTLMRKPDRTAADERILRSSLCGWAGNEPRVCCVDEVTTTTTTAAPRTTPKSNPNSDCVTPDGTPGQCVEIFSCTSLISLLHSGVKESEDYIYRSRCPGKGEHVVCCASVANNSASQTSASPPDPNTGCCGQHRKTEDKIIETTSCPIVQGIRLQCKPITNCPALQTLMRKPDRTAADERNLRSLMCGVAGNVPRVCCVDEVTTTTTTAATRTTPKSNPNSDCVTPDGTPGQCVEINSCLINLLQSGVNDSVDYISRSRCPGKGEYVVCCASVANNCASQMSASPPDPNTGCCGQHRTTGDKIIGGNRTEVDQYPWLALIEYRKGRTNKTLCGGTLISGKYVLTAGHCVTGEALTHGRPVNVRLGEYDQTNEGPDCIPAAGGGMDCTQGVTRIPIESIIPHPRYNPIHTTLGYDIALIRLTQAAPYTYFIRPICLPTEDVTLKTEDFNVIAAGWGAVSAHQRSSPEKQHVTLPFVRREQCQLAFNAPPRYVNLWSGQLCAGGVKGKDSCKGDSGGPLMWYKNKHIMEVIGVVSFGILPCAIENIPGVYTNVYEFNNWIRSTIVP